MNITDKLQSILTIKDQMKIAISTKGVDIDDNTPFSQYPILIDMIDINVDTTPPVITSFVITGNLDKTASVTGVTESESTVVLKNPNNVAIPLTVNADGTFNGTIVAVAVEGVYTLTVSDTSGNSTTVTQNLTLPAPADPIKSLFTTGIEGAYFDPNDLTTVFQDVAATIPVTAVGQTIGCIKDKSGNNNHLIQPTVSMQPKLTKDAVTGSYGILWDGVDDIMYAQIPNIVSTSVQMFYAQRFSSLPLGVSGMALSPSISIPINGNALIISSSYDDFYSALVFKCFRNPNMAALKSQLPNLKYVVGLSHKVGEKLAIWVNKGKTVSNMFDGNGVSWSNPSPSYIVLGKSWGVTYKSLMIGRTLTDAEISIVNEQLNLDVGAW